MSISKHSLAFLACLVVQASCVTRRIHRDIHQELIVDVDGNEVVNYEPQRTRNARTFHYHEPVAEPYGHVMHGYAPLKVLMAMPAVRMVQRQKVQRRTVLVRKEMFPVPVECFEPPDKGRCGKDMERVYYDRATRTCKKFSYAGCGRNANRFLSTKNCYKICNPRRVKPGGANYFKNPH